MPRSQSSSLLEHTNFRGDNAASSGVLACRKPYHQVLCLSARRNNGVPKCLEKSNLSRGSMHLDLALRIDARA